MKKIIISTFCCLCFAIGTLFAQDSGTCGTNLVWILDGDGANKTLTITGTGAMNNYSSGTAPWYAERQNIKTLVVDNSVTTIGQYAFYGCEYITSASIGIVVTTIGDYAFQGCSRLGSITIPDNITSVGNYAFQNCTGLTTVNFNPTNCSTMGYSYYPVFNGCTNFTTLNIGSNVTRIPDYSFQNCTGLTSVTVPNNVGTIGSAAFGGCSGLVDITLPFVGQTVSATSTSGLFGYIFGTSSYTGGTAKQQYYSGSSYYTYYIPSSLRTATITNDPSISAGAFSNCSMLTNISINESNSSAGHLTIGSSVTSIGDYAFRGCTGITTVNFNPTNCTTMGSNSYPVFSGCTNFTTLNIGSNVTRIPDYAFYGCSTIVGTLTIPNLVTYIGNSSFYNCSSFTGTLTLPISLITIGGSAFYGCSGFSGTLTIPELVTSIGGAAFQNCSGLSTVNFNATNCTGNPTAAVFSGCTNFTTLNIANNVTRIPNYIFYECSNITSTLTVPESVIYIGNYAFRNCSKIVSQNLPLSFVNRIGDYAFYNCMRLDGYLSVKDTVGNYAFGLCIALDSVNIPSTAKKLGDDAFFSCLGLKTINYNAVNCETMGSATLPVFSGCSGVTTLNIASDVTKIPDNAFYSCSGLTSVNIPASVTYVGSQAFKNCTGLTSMLVPENVTTIGDAAFSGCAALVDITLPFVGKSISATNIRADSTVLGYIFGTTSYTGGTSISQNYYSGTKTFYLPTTLRNVTITGSTDLKYGSFYNCNMLTTITLPSTLQYIREYVFYNCSGLKEFTVPENVGTIGNYAFQNCTGLTTLNFNPTNCTTNGGTNYPAFSGCTNLSKINVGNNVTRIQDYSFKDCTGLDTIVSYATTVPSAYTNSFNGLTVADVDVIVPCNTLTNYQSEFGWQDFSNMTEQCENYTISVSAGANGQISPSGNQTVAFGQNTTFTFTPDTNYEINEVLIDGVNNTEAVAAGSYTFENANTNHSFSVTFKKLTYTIAVSSDENGTITPASNQTVEIGNNLTVTFAPNTEYEIYQVLIDDVNNLVAVSTGSYTFENVTENHSIIVTFKLSGSVHITTATNNDYGIVLGEGFYERDSNATLYAVPSLNSNFSGWSDGNTSNPRTIVVTAESVFTANFERCNAAEFLEQIEALKNDTVILNTKITTLITDTTRLFAENTALTNDTIRLFNQNSVLTNKNTQLVSDTLRLYVQVQEQNVAIISLQNQIVTLKADSTSLQNQLTTANSTVSDLQSQISTLQSDKTALENTITELNETITLLHQLLDECQHGTGTQQVLSNKIGVYPNPAKHELFITSESWIESIEIYNTAGVKVLSDNHFSGKVDLSTFSNSTYFVKIKTSESWEVKKIIVNK
ncbi:MAG: leucine-rich repeat protein [Candidatus Symbiothrix sp.]|jgi:hypothetical protein|nr:leucine-rich repeat protein [Candidatus Symbiothrix sp.]